MTPERKFLCRLSLVWGKPQTEIEETVSARDIDEMAEFYGQEPWGSWRDNVHAALITSTIANTFRRKGSKRADWRDFMLADPKERKQQRLSSFLEWLKSVAKPKG